MLGRAVVPDFGKSWTPAKSRASKRRGLVGRVLRGKGRIADVAVASCGLVGAGVVEEVAVLEGILVELVGGMSVVRSSVWMQADCWERSDSMDVGEKCCYHGA